MSYTTIIHVYPNDKIESGKELSNSHGSAPFVWNLLCQKYCGTKPYGYFTGRALDRLCPRYRDQSVPLAHRAVLAMTFDFSYVAKKDYAQAAQHIREFLEEFKDNTHVNHWPWIASMYEANPNVPGIGIYHTSVSENPYMKWDESLEQEVPRWDDIYSIYDDLTSEEKK